MLKSWSMVYQEMMIFSKKKVDHINHTVRSKYNISLDELVILYMPTFRDDASTKAYNLDYDKVINSFQDFYNRKVKVLIRFHPNVDNTFLIILIKD